LDNKEKSFYSSFDDFSHLLKDVDDGDKSSNNEDVEGGVIVIVVSNEDDEGNICDANGDDEGSGCDVVDDDKWQRAIERGELLMLEMNLHA